ncbi:MAG: hypothetical protein SOT28_08065 [Fusicatenibacter sp.]|nr:hypothetical protein [Fusicatenibacter sp.]
MYYFSEHNERGNHAGTKARNDVETILQKNGAIPVNSNIFILRSDETENHIYSNIQNRFDLIRLFGDLWRIKGKKVLIQYPMLAFDFQKTYFEKIAKHNELVLLVHDLHSLRIPDAQKQKEEIELLNIASAIIVHNRFMEQKIRSMGVLVPKVYDLELFDYLYDGKKNENFDSKNSIAFAGNLSKSVFLSELVEKNPTIEFRFYGVGWNSEYQGQNVHYCGNFKPEVIPEKLSARYGLVWDGDSVMSGSGALGEYTRINNPHKLSLYLAAGIPVIVWREAAVAEVVQKYGVGITLERIDHLEEVLANISEQNYSEMKQNTEKIREKLIKGEYLERILKQLQ